MLNIICRQCDRQSIHITKCTKSVTTSNFCWEHSWCKSDVYRTKRCIFFRRKVLYNIMFYGTSVTPSSIQIQKKLFLVAVIKVTTLCVYGLKLTLFACTKPPKAMRCLVVNDHRAIVHLSSYNSLYLPSGLMKSNINNVDNCYQRVFRLTLDANYRSKVTEGCW